VACLLDTSSLTVAFALVEDARTANLTDFIHFNFFQIGHIDRENTLHPYVARHFADRKGFGSSRTAALQNHPTEKLGTGLFAFFNLVVHRDGVAG
jgi:hypothetical protein